MQDLITTFMEHYGYLGVFLLIFLENVFPPIPSELILTFGGFMTTSTSMQVPLVIVIATVGSVVGAVALYGIGALVPEPQLKAFIKRSGAHMGFSEGDIGKAYGWYDKYGYWSVFLCRMVPIVRSLISVPAGMLRMPMLPFLVFTGLGSAIWNTILVCAGAALGENWASVMDFTARYDKMMYVLMAGIAIYVIYRIVRKKLR